MIKYSSVKISRRYVKNIVKVILIVTLLVVVMTTILPSLTTHYHHNHHYQQPSEGESHHNEREVNVHQGDSDVTTPDNEDSVDSSSGDTINQTITAGKEILSTRNARVVCTNNYDNKEDVDVIKTTSDNSHHIIKTTIDNLRQVIKATIDNLRQVIKTTCVNLDQVIKRSSNNLDQVIKRSSDNLDQVIKRSNDNLDQVINHLSPKTNQVLVAEEPSTFIPNDPDTTRGMKPATIPKRFLIEEPDYCQKRPGLQIIAYVHSSIMRVEERNDTRSTWANASAYDLGDISVKVGAVFMVGRPKNDEERNIIQKESQQYHDIVQGDYGDHYRLLSYKGLASLYWINRHCRDVPWTLHSDDDTHIDIFLFYRALKELDPISKQQFICSHMYGPVLREGRWKVSPEEYPEKEYPLYCSGGVWFLQTRLISFLLQASKVVPYLWVDDAYITGVLAVKAGIKRLGFHDFYGNHESNHTVIGHQVAWFTKAFSRWSWWTQIVNYHRNHSLHNPPTLIPIGKFNPGK
ncbi:hypothetical protein OTU49_012084 [Cherax quadricarinatus]|uniref:Hexosyltransferase n=2 Tax=Cherax quadricarinatus TaxID=27406 RepID=A0AAW0W106_CHEQU